MASQESEAHVVPTDLGRVPTALLGTTLVVGTILNHVIFPRYTDTDCIMERRRNQIILSFPLYLILLGLTIATAVAGSRDDAFQVLNWIVLFVPWATGIRNLFELHSSLIRDVKTWPWFLHAAREALPLAWLYRTKTPGDDHADEDAEWLSSDQWDSLKYNQESHATQESAWNAFWTNMVSAHKGLNASSTRESSIYHLTITWSPVLREALRTLRKRVCKGPAVRTRSRWCRCCSKIGNVALLFIGYILLLGCWITMALLFVFEFSILWLCDRLRWSMFRVQGKIEPKYDAAHFSEEDMQKSLEIRKKITEEMKAAVEEKKRRNGESNNEDIQLDKDMRERYMRATITTAAVLGNAFRKAYMGIPVYRNLLSARKVLRNTYASLGCDIDVICKSVRELLEERHTPGLLSIAYGSLTAATEACLHDNIEAIFSVCFNYTTMSLYRIARFVANIETEIDRRLSETRQSLPHNAEKREKAFENIHREQVVYIDARNALFWLLWVNLVATSEIKKQHNKETNHKNGGDNKEGAEFLVEKASGDIEEGLAKTAPPSYWHGFMYDFTSPQRYDNEVNGVDEEDITSVGEDDLTDEDIAALYAIAFFMSRARYWKNRYSLKTEDELLAGSKEDAREESSKLYRVARELIANLVAKKVKDKYDELSNALKQVHCNSDFSIGGWVENEYHLRMNLTEEDCKKLILFDPNIGTELYARQLAVQRSNRNHSGTLSS